MKLKEKYTKPNINFGSVESKVTMMTVAQANEKSISLNMGR